MPTPQKLGSCKNYYRAIVLNAIEGRPHEAIGDFAHHDDAVAALVMSGLSVDGYPGASDGKYSPSPASGVCFTGMVEVHLKPDILHSLAEYDSEMPDRWAAYRSRLKEQEDARQRKEAEFAAKADEYRRSGLSKLTASDHILLQRPIQSASQSEQLKIINLLLYTLTENEVRALDLMHVQNQILSAHGLSWFRNLARQILEMRNEAKTRREEERVKRESQVEGD